MSDLTEIYICKAGQALKEGKVVYSDEITSKRQAIPDAEDRCRRDSKIAKIAYYAVNEEGDFRCIYMHTVKEVQEESKATEPKPRKPLKKKPKPTLWQRLTGQG